MRKLTYILFGLMLAGAMASGCGKQPKSAEDAAKHVDSAATDNNTSWQTEEVSQSEALEMANSVKPFLSKFIIRRDTLSGNIVNTAYRIELNFGDMLEITCYQKDDSNSISVISLLQGCVNKENFNNLAIIRKGSKLTISSVPSDSNTIHTLSYNKLTDKIRKSLIAPIAKFDSAGVRPSQRHEKWVSHFDIKFTDEGVKLINTDGQKFEFYIPYNFSAATPEALDVLKQRSRQLLPPFVIFDISGVVNLFISEDYYVQLFNPDCL